MYIKEIFSSEEYGINYRSIPYSILQDNAEEIFNKGIHIIQHPMSIPIHRCRVNKNKEVFYYQDQLAFPRLNIFNSGEIFYNRASSNLHEVFYGAVFTSEIEAGLACAYPEITDIKEWTDPLKSEYFTYSEWWPTRNLNLVYIGDYRHYLDPSTELMKLSGLRKKLSEEIKNRLPQKSRIIDSTFDSLSYQFSKPIYSNKDYKLSAAFGDVVFSKSLLGMNIDGIVYPSVAAFGKAINVAISGHVIDQGALALRHAAILEGFKVDKQIYLDYKYLSPNINSFKISWQEAPNDLKIHPQLRNYLRQKAIYLAQQKKAWNH